MESSEKFDRIESMLKEFIKKEEENIARSEKLLSQTEEFAQQIEKSGLIITETFNKCEGQVDKVIEISDKYLEINTMLKNMINKIDSSNSGT
jgi:hypothetical protein